MHSTPVVKSRATPNFDRIARPYRWMEYLTFGSLLGRCRFFRLSELGRVRKALILGDGDGRFTAKLLAANPEIQVDAVDVSAAMLGLLSARVAALGRETVGRLTLHHIDARNLTLPGDDYDLVVTHFFLDCFTSAELEALVNNLRPHLAFGALWVVSEFHIPTRRTAAIFSRLVVKFLYLAFHWLTGLSVQALPDYRTTLRKSGLARIETYSWLGGLLVSELWRVEETVTNSQQSQR